MAEAATIEIIRIDGAYFGETVESDAVIMSIPKAHEATVETVLSDAAYMEVE